MCQNILKKDRKSSVMLWGIPFFLPSQLRVCLVEELILVLSGVCLFYCKILDGILTARKERPVLQKVRAIPRVREVRS